VNGVENVNLNVLFNLATGVFYILVLLFYIMPRAVREALLPRSWISPISWALLASFVISVAALTPTLVYQYLRLRGIENEGLRDFINNTAGVFRLASLFMIVTIYKFKRPDGSK
jgi:hypothetical protein